MPAIERLAAKLGHLALYGLMIAIPIDGILMSQYGGREINVFGFIMPIMVEKNDAMKAIFKEGHEVLGWGLALLLLAHVAAALRHRFILKDQIMARMLPGRG
jgi:cytochrome b561